MMNFLQNLCLPNVAPYDFLLWVLVFSCIIIFWRWNLDKHNSFNLMDLVCDHGKLSSGKFMRAGSWAVMSYGFYLLAKTSPENLVAYAPLYGGIWVSARALDRWQQTNTVGVTAASTHTETLNHTINENITYTAEQVDKIKENHYSED